MSSFRLGKGHYIAPIGEWGFPSTFSKEYIDRYEASLPDNPLAPAQHVESWYRDVEISTARYLKF